MAVVKVSYTRSKEAAKATIRYITRRPGREGRAVTRDLFGHDGVMSKQQADRMIEKAAGNTIFFRIIISPDPKQEDKSKDLNLPEITTQTILSLETRLKREIHFAAAEHDDHAPHRHVHVLALLPQRLAVSDLTHLRLAATQAALTQRLERDLARSQTQGARIHIPQPQPRATTPAIADLWMPPGQGRGGERRHHSPRLDQKACPHCGHSVTELATWCSNCGLKITRKKSINMGTKNKDREWER